MLKKEISSVKNWKDDFRETALCSIISSHRVTAFPSRSPSLRLFLWSLKSDI
ncbi:putative nef attachable protein [Chlamydia psittaci 02DC21]|nr:putative nef attachable protein [Chlamydia psittaci 02DC21]